MEEQKRKDGFIPFKCFIPKAAHYRIREEAKRRKLSEPNMVRHLIELLASRGTAYASTLGPDPRLEKFGFSYKNVDWDDPDQGIGVTLGEFVMQYLPPSRKELQ